MDRARQVEGDLPRECQPLAYVAALAGGGAKDVTQRCDPPPPNNAHAHAPAAVVTFPGRMSCPAGRHSARGLQNGPCRLWGQRDSLLLLRSSSPRRCCTGPSNAAFAWPPPPCLLSSPLCRYTSSWLAAEQARDGEWWTRTLAPLRQREEAAAGRAAGAAGPSPAVAAPAGPAAPPDEAAEKLAGKAAKKRRESKAAAADAAGKKEEGEVGQGGAEAAAAAAAAAAVAAAAAAVSHEDAELQQRERQVSCRCKSRRCAI